MVSFLVEEGIILVLVSFFFLVFVLSFVFLFCRSILSYSLHVFTLSDETLSSIERYRLLEKGDSEEFS